jgi:hypothetical protein
MVIILCIFDMNILCDHIYNLIYIYIISIYTHIIHDYIIIKIMVKSLVLKPWG